MLFCSAAEGYGASSVVKVTRDGDGWQLLRDGKPFFIKGAGGSSSKPLLAKLGGNSFRTWGADDIGDQLDEAQRLGLGVTVGIWLRHEGDNGFSYANTDQVARQLDVVHKAVNRYKDHPAVLIWSLGNETEGFKAGDDPAIWKAINDAAALTKHLDGNHPTMTVIAEVGGARVKSLNELCPAIDIVGINSYGGVTSVGERYKKAGGTRPYVITEFGPAGTWEGANTAWDAPIEPTSTRKGDVYRQAYKKGVLAEHGLYLGSYAFTWAFKQEATTTWYGMFLSDGSQLEPVHTMAELWSGTAPANHCPSIKNPPHLDGGSDQFTAGQLVHAAVDVADPDGDHLNVTWVLARELARGTPGGMSMPDPQKYPELILSSSEHDVRLHAPSEPGVYRLYVYAYDDHGNAATANVPLRVKADASH
jgi:hypothetical protein